MIDRREFIKKSLLFTTAIIIPSRSYANVYEKSISLYHVHTGESIDAVFWVEGEYIFETFENLEYFFRDFRTNDIYPVDIDLVEYLYSIKQRMATHREFYIHSAYRSPQTNEYLRHHIPGVAKNSYHMYGKAVDFTLPGYRLATLKRAALSLRRGGVGYYPKLNFIHIDTGKPRYWEYPRI